MAKKLNTRIQLKHGLAANWADKNPVLLAGEMGIETDTLKMKVGDGTSNWNALGYLGADANDILAIINENRDSCTTVEVTEGQSDTEALATISNPKNGDTAILVKVISGDKKSYTAFVYDNAWKAMDGNYNASNVYFDKDLTYTVGIGTLTKPSSSATFNAAGKSVEEVVAKEAKKKAKQEEALKRQKEKEAEIEAEIIEKIRKEQNKRVSAPKSIKAAGSSIRLKVVTDEGKKVEKPKEAVSRTNKGTTHPKNRKGKNKNKKKSGK